MVDLADIKEFPIDDAKQAILAAWSGMGLPVDLSWEEGSIPAMQLEVGARMWHAGSLTAVNMKGLTLGESATGPGLTLWSKSVYNHDRYPSNAAIWLVRVACAAGSGPYTLEEGSMIITDGSSTFTVTGDAAQYPEVSGYSLPRTLSPSTYIDLAFVCDIPGTTGGSPSVAAINRLVTTYTGVTVSNLSLIRAGTNEESDPELRQRNSTWWATRNALTMTRDAYIYYARNADAAVRRVELIDNNPRGAFTLDVILASSTGTVGPGPVANVLAALRQRMLKPAGDLLEVRSATTVTPTLAGAIYYYSGFSLVAVQNAITAALETLAIELPIGGQTFTGFGSHQVLRSQYEKAILGANIGGQPCVKLVVLTSPPESTTIDPDGVITIGTLTFGSGGLTLNAVTE